MTAWLPRCRAAARASASWISRSLEARVGESAERRPRRSPGPAGKNAVRAAAMAGAGSARFCATCARRGRGREPRGHDLCG